MQYRHFPKIPNENISALGLGLMRLPVLDGDSSKIDDKASQIVENAIAAGINYFDTAWPYHQKQSEIWLGKTMQKLGLRKSINIATKMPVWEVKEESDYEKIFSKQLENLQTDYIDFYLMHALNKERWESIQKLNGLKFLEKAKADGRIRHIGFSFHDSFDSFKSIIDGYENWEFCQIMYNYLDEDFQAGSNGLKYAAEKYLGVVIMEPLRGGALANISKEMQTITSSYDKPRTPAEWALRHVLDRQEVTTVLSGMNSIEQLLENVGVSCSAFPNSMLKKEKDIVSKLKEAFEKKMNVSCSACNYCKPCPNKVDIPAVFDLWNSASMFGTIEKSKNDYAQMVKNGTSCSSCVNCGLCKTKCPQNIDIPSMLTKANSELI